MRYKDLQQSLENYLTDIDRCEDNNDFTGALATLQGMRQYFDGFLEGAEGRLRRSETCKAEYERMREIIVVFRGKDYLVQKAAYEAMHELYDTVVKAGKMKPDEATAIVLWNAGLLDGAIYLDTVRPPLRVANEKYRAALEQAAKE